MILNNCLCIFPPQIRLCTVKSLSQVLAKLQFYMAHVDAGCFKNNITLTQELFVLLWILRTTLLSPRNSSSCCEYFVISWLNRSNKYLIIDQWERNHTILLVTWDIFLLPVENTTANRAVKYASSSSIWVCFCGGSKMFSLQLWKSVRSNVVSLSYHSSRTVIRHRLFDVDHHHVVLLVFQVVCWRSHIWLPNSWISVECSYFWTSLFKTVPPCGLGEE